MAVTSAHNLLTAVLDNHLYWGNRLGIDPRRILWRRVMDMNDRTLRDITVGLGGPGNGTPRESGRPDRGPAPDRSEGQDEPRVPVAG